MALDQTANFVRGGVSSSIASGDTTINVVDASIFPDPANGNYNLVIWDADQFVRPDEDSNTEVFRVTGQDTTNDTLTVTRAQEGTTAVSHPSTSEMHLSATAKFFRDIDDNKVELSGDTMTGALDIDSSFPQETVTDTVNGSKSGFQLEDPTAANYGGLLYFDDTASETRLYGLNNGTEQGGLAVARDSDTVSITGDFIADDGEIIWDESSTFIPTARLQNDSMTIAGNAVSLGGSTAINHTNLSNIVSDQHHTKYTNSEAISAVEGARFSELAFDNIEDPGTTRSIGIDDSEGVLFKDSGGNTYPLWNSKHVNGGTDVSISGGSGAGSTPITISHNDTSTQGNVSAGAGAAITDINLDGRGHTTSISTTDFDSRYDDYSSFTFEEGDGESTAIGSGQRAIVSGGTDINTELTSTSPATIEVRHNNTSSQGNVSTGGATVIDDINLDGRGHVTNLNTQNRSLDDWATAVDDNLVEFGSNSDFSIFYDSSGDDLVIRDETNNVDLIRQPKQGPTEFIQGADIGSIEAPEDSFTQLSNAAVTSASASGDTIGYTFAVDNQTGLEVSATSDGSGGLSSGPIAALGGDLEAANGETIWDESATEIPDSAMGSIANSTLTNSSVTVAGNSVSLGGSTTVNHNDLSTISSDDHHTKYTDSDAETAINNDADHGSTASHNYFSGSHTDLSNITSNDHHSKTSSASELTDVSADSVSGAHHTKYTDENAQDAVGPIVNGGTDITTNYDDANNLINVNHADSSTQGNVSTGGATVIDDIGLDGRGHVTNLNTENRSLDDWANANADINLGGNDIDAVYDIYSQSGGRILLRAQGSAGEIGFYDESTSTWVIRQYNGGDVQFDASGRIEFKKDIYTSGELHEGASL